MVDLKYANAFSEVLEILFNLTEEEYNKIPTDFIIFLDENKNPDYDFYYDSNKTLSEQNVLYETKVLIAIICRDYLATDDEKAKILEKEKKELIEYEEKQNEEFDIDKVFKQNNEENENTENKNENTNKELIENKEENIFTKFINKIKRLLHIK